jgi:hypothetical protein
MRGLFIVERALHTAKRVFVPDSLDMYLGLTICESVFKCSDGQRESHAKASKSSHHGNPGDKTLCRSVFDWGILTGRFVHLPLASLTFSIIETFRFGTDFSLIPNTQ